MHGVYLVELDKVRPAILLTRDSVAPRMRSLTFAPITSTIRGLSTEVPVGPENGLDHDSVISCDNITTLPREALGRRIGSLTVEQEARLTAAVVAAFRLL